jgi:EpsI family protein
MKELAQIRIESWIKGAIYALLLAGIFYTSHRVMVIWWGREDYSYCYLIAPVVLYLIWEKREALGRVPAQPSWMGVLPLLFGIFLFWLGELAGEFTTMYFASWFVLVGLLWSHLGWQKLKVIWFPVAFIVAMFPPPNFFHFNLTLRLKLISSQIGVWMLQAYGMSAYREGNIIDLGFTQLQVVDACSGLRYLYPLVIMAILLAYFFKSAWWKKIILVVSAVPLTILTNSFRIAMTGVLYETWGPAVAEDFFHGFSGWFIFMFGFAVLLLEMWALNGFKAFKASGSGKALEASGQSGLNQFEEGEPGREITSVNPISLTCNAKHLDGQGDVQRPKGMKAFLSPPQFLAALILLGATLGIAQTVEFREEIPPAKDFAEFPQVVGEWSGKRDRMDQKFIDTLNFNDYVIVDYVNGGHAVNFYTAYYQTQRKGESIHSPETCLPGGGWEFKKGGSVTLPISTRNGRPMRVNRAFMEKGTHKQLSYFWFPQRDRVLTNAWELKLYNFWDALTRQRTDGALVRLITPLYPGEDVADADERLVFFTQAIVPVLNEYLPK